MVKRVGLILGAVGVSAVFLFVFLYWARPVAAQGLIIVNPGESIQAAIDGASDGDTILIMAGTYTESLTLNKAVSLTGVSSATTILHAEPNDRVLTVTGAMITNGVVISGLMLTGGFIYNSGHGGGAALLNFAHPSFINVMFYDNWALDGGALWDEQQVATLYFTHTSFMENTSFGKSGGVKIGDGVVMGGHFINNHCIGNFCRGGAINAETLIVSGTKMMSNTADYDGAIDARVLTVTDSFFAYNSCTRDFCHAGALSGNDFVLISGSTFLSNSATSTGGAIIAWDTGKIINSFIYGNHCDNFCWGGSVYAAGLIEITGTTFSNNTSDYWGGGIFGDEDVTIYDSVVVGNTAERGGGIYAHGTVNIVDTVFAGNQCGSVPCDGGGAWVSGTTTISGSTFMSNTAVSDGGGLWVQQDAIIYNSLFRGNSGDEGGGAFVYGSAWVSDSLFEENGGAGILAFDTLRATNTVFSGNYSLNISGYGGGIATTHLYLTDTWVISNSTPTTFGHGAGAYADVSAVVVDSYFADNHCLANTNCYGGGLYVSPNVNNSLLVSNSVFGNNVALDGGSGIYANGPTIVHNSFFTDNTCVGIDCVGAGLATYGVLTLMQNVFVNNVAVDGQGGAVYAWQPNIPFSGGGVTNTALVINNLFAENTAGFREGTIHFENGVVEMVHNTIVASDADNDVGIYFYDSVASLTNTIVTSYSEAVRVGPFSFVSEDYNLFYDNFTIFSGGVSSGGNSIYDGDPDFVDPAAGDYHIGVGSAGLDNALDVGVMVDLDGKPRPIGPAPDRGAYEAGIPEPIAGLNAVNSSPTIVGNTTLMTATVTTGNGVAYDWRFGDGMQGNGAAVSHVYPDVGVYTAVVTASNSLNFMTATTVISVVDEAIAGLMAVNDSPTVIGSGTQLTATILSGTNVSYSWGFGDGTLGSGAVVSHVYPTVGMYTAVVTAENSVSTMTATTVVVVQDVPIVGLAVSSNSPVQLGEAVVLTATVSAGTNVSYAWDFGDGSGGMGQVVSHVYGMAGSFTVTVTATNGAGQAVVTTVVVVLEPPTTMWSVYMPVVLKP